MNLLLQLMLIALRRLGAHAGLALCALLALVIAVALATSIPLYAEAASFRILQDELARQEARQGRSPFALLMRYVATQNQNRALPWATVTPADTLLAEARFTQLGLPLRSIVRHARSEPLRLALPAAGGTPTGKFVTLGFLSGIEAQIQLREGRAPTAATSLAAPVETLISRELADALGLNVGDELRGLATVRGQPVAIPLQVAGIWAATNAHDPAWPLQVAAFDDMLLLPEATFTGPLAAALETPVSQMLWYMDFDAADLTPAQAQPLRAQVERLRAETASLLPGLRIEQGPVEPLAAYQRAATTLTLQLAVVATPTLALIIAFIIVVAGLLTQRQASEIALLTSRGVRDSRILAIAAIEWLLLGGLALALGPALGLGIARIVAATSSFLRLDPTLPPMALSFTANALIAALLVTGLALLAVLTPTAVATRRTLAAAQRDRSRTTRVPFWQRTYSDLLLTLVALYGLFLLHQDNRLLGGRDPIANPLLLAVPTLLCLSGGLLLIRGTPWLLERLARFAARPSWITPLLVLRTLARQPAAYRGSLLLLVLTLSLAMVSAAIAATADSALHAAVAYQVGAQTQLIETGESTEAFQPGAGGQGGASGQRDIREEPRFLFVPVSERLTVPGIHAATRVGHYAAMLRLGGTVTTAQLIGIDRRTFPQVAPMFEPNWAGGASLGALMNLLASHPDGVLVSRSALAQGLRIGDRLPITAEVFGDRQAITLRVVGAIDLWPGVYPQDGPLLVLNLDALFDQLGGQYPYDVWITRDPAVPLGEIMRDVRRLGVALIDVSDVAERTRIEQTRPQRQGLFGMLSVGFVAAGGLSAISFVLGALITARRRTIELGVLRAMGLSGGRALSALALEQAILILIGVIGGLAVGAVTVALVVPMLHVGVGPWPGTPPVVVRQPWSELALPAALVALALSMALLALTIVQSRLRLLEAVKLGEVS